MTINSYSISATDGTKVEITNGDHITGIAGRDSDLYITDIMPYAQGMYPEPQIVAPVNVCVENLKEIDETTFAPKYYQSANVLGQVKTTKAQDTSKTPDSPEAKEVLYFNNANADQEFSLIKVECADSLRGETYAGLFDLERAVTTLTGGNDLLGIPGSESTVYTPLKAIFVELTDQYRFGNVSREKFVSDARVKAGDAMIKLKRSAISQSQIESANHFRITPRGGSPIKYIIWNGSEGIVQEQQYVWCLYLQKVRE